MRILLNNIYYYPNLAGGAEISVMKLAEELVKIQGNIVSVLCISDNGKYEQETINGVKVYRLPLKGDKQSRIKSRLNRVYNFTDYCIVRETICKINPEVLHTNNLRAFSVAIWKVAKELKIPVVHTLRDYVLIDVYRYRIEKAIIKHYSNMVSAITAPSLYTLNTHLRAGLFSEAKEKCSIVNAIDIDMEKVSALFNEKAKNRNKNHRIFRFAYIGRFSEEKGVDWLVKVFSEHSENKELHLFGSGTLKVETVERMKQQPSVVEHGMLPEVELNLCLKEIDVVIVPPLWEEPFGRVILDAYKNGIPVIVTNRGGMPENVQNGKTGLIIEPTDSDLQEAIHKMCNIEKIDTMCDNILALISKYTVKTQAERFMKLYKKVM